MKTVPWVPNDTHWVSQARAKPVIIGCQSSSLLSVWAFYKKSVLWEIIIRIVITFNVLACFDLKWQPKPHELLSLLLINNLTVLPTGGGGGW